MVHRCGRQGWGAVGGLWGQLLGRMGGDTVCVSLVGCCLQVIQVCGEVLWEAVLYVGPWYVWGATRLLGRGTDTDRSLISEHVGPVCAGQTEHSSPPTHPQRLQPLRHSPRRSGWIYGGRAG